MLSPSFVVKCVTFAAATNPGRYFCSSRFPLIAIHYSGRYFEISFDVSPGHVVNASSLISWIGLSFVGQQRT